LFAIFYILFFADWTYFYDLDIWALIARSCLLRSSLLHLVLAILLQLLLERQRVSFRDFYLGGLDVRLMAR